MPTFLVIGAMKAGTTSLYHYLRAHPEVFMPTIKEPEFFVAGSNRSKGIEWYRRLFAPAGTEAVALGEASTAYTKHPHFPGVPGRIAELIPDCRLIYVVRDPVQRIRSHYRMRVREGSEKAPIERAVVQHATYLDYSRYADQVDQYLRCFPADQLLVITSEDLRDARLATTQRVYRFLGIDPDFVPADLDREYYRSDEQPSRSLVPLWLRKGLKRHFPAAKGTKEFENALFRRLRRRKRGRDGGSSPSVPVSDDVSDELRSIIVEALKDDVGRLRTFLAPEFDGWGIA
jgi:hypothetical protein